MLDEQIYPEGMEVNSDFSTVTADVNNSELTETVQLDSNSPLTAAAKDFYERHGVKNTDDVKIRTSSKYLSVYTIQDLVSGLFDTILIQKNYGMLKRMLKDTLPQSGGEIFRHPNDYVVYHIGYLDNEAGSLTPVLPVSMDSIADILNDSKS